MAIVKTIGQTDTGIARVAEDQPVDVRSTRDGSLFTADWKQAMILEGRGFMINLGALTSPVTGGGTGGLAVESGAPEFVVGIPSGTSILPLRVDIVCGFPVGALDDDEVDIVLAVDQDKDNGVASGSFNATKPPIYNMNTLHNRSSGCWCNQQYTATMTAPALDIELAHVTKVFEQFATTGSKTEAWWQGFAMHYEPKTLAIINGPAMLIGYFGGTAGGTAAAKGFVTCQWIELPSSYF